VKRLLLPLSFLALTSVLWESVTPAHACISDPDFDPISASDVIVAGRFTGWEPAPDIQIPEESREYVSPAVPVRVHMAVDQTWRRDLPPQIDVVDVRAVDIDPRNGEYSWRYSVWEWPYLAGSTEPPTGKYVIMGLEDADDGTLREVWTFFAGDEPSGERWDGAIAKMSSLPKSDFPYPVAVALAVIGPLAFLVGAAFLWRWGESHNG